MKKFAAILLAGHLLSASASPLAKRHDMPDIAKTSNEMPVKPVGPVETGKPKHTKPKHGGYGPQTTTITSIIGRNVTPRTKTLPAKPGETVTVVVYCPSGAESTPEPAGTVITTTTFVTDTQGFTSTLPGGGQTTTVLVGDPIDYVTTTKYIPDNEMPYTRTLTGDGPERTVEVGIPQTFVTNTITSGTVATTVTKAQPSGTVPGTVEVILPTPDLSCDNQGLQYAVMKNENHNNYPSDTQYSNFKAEDFKKNLMDVAKYGEPGVATSVGFSNTNPGQAFKLYGKDPAFRTDYVAINHRGYIYAREAGTYTFTFPKADEITILWVGDEAKSAYTRANSKATQIYPVAQPVVHTMQLEQGRYYPLRILYANAQGVAEFSFKVTAPNGEEIISDKTDKPSPYLVQFSCDSTSAPKYPPFGQE